MPFILNILNNIMNELKKYSHNFFPLLFSFFHYSFGSFAFLLTNAKSASAISLLSPPTSANRRRSSVMFNDYVILHTPPSMPEPSPDRNPFSLEKMTQAGDGSIWQVRMKIFLLTVWS